MYGSEKPSFCDRRLFGQLVAKQQTTAGNAVPVPTGHIGESGNPGIRELGKRGSVALAGRPNQLAASAGEGKGVRYEWYLIGQKPYDFSGLYWSLGLVISLYGFGLRLTTRGSYLSGRLPTTCFRQQSSIVSQSFA